jgi:hypothetical protein
MRLVTADVLMLSTPGHGRPGCPLFPRAYVVGSVGLVLGVSRPGSTVTRLP